MLSGLPGSHVCYGLPDCSPPCTDLTSFPANGGLYFQAFDGSVTLPLAGYDYSIDWTPMLTGLSPAGLTASLAAPTPSSQWTFTTYSLPVSRRTPSSALTPRFQIDRRWRIRCYATIGDTMASSAEIRSCAFNRICSPRCPPLT